MRGRPASSAPMGVCKHGLFAAAPGEDPGIGITMAADLFRERGWKIDLMTDTGHDAILTHVKARRPQIVGLSLSPDPRMNALVRLVAGLRICLPEAATGVMPAAAWTPIASDISSISTSCATMPAQPAPISFGSWSCRAEGHRRHSGRTLHRCGSPQTCLHECS